jgi:post-segregation antitoxin (ccd killing protein)
MKIHTTISLDIELWEKAQIEGINLSGTLNNLLGKYLNIEKKPEEITEEEEKLIAEMEKEEERKAHLFKLAKELWLSDIGRETIKKSHELARERGYG